MIELSAQQTMMLIQIASKACEYRDEFMKGLFPEEFLMRQVGIAIEQAIPILGLIDEKYPGLMPVPHNGVTWAERAKG